MLCFHQGFGWAKGGYLGVDLFFVLSGFLIAGKLINERRATGRIDLVGFWGGRFRRLLPALLFVLVGVAAYAQFFAEPLTLRDIRIDAYAALAYVANWRFILDDVGYFAGTAAPSPVRHLWSLSVEEQFYLLFPVLLVVLARRARTPRQLVPAFAALVAASTMWTGYLAWRGAEPTRLYEGTDTRLATILVGVVVAVVVRTWRRPPASLGPAAAVAALVAFGIAVVARGDSAWMYPLGQLAFAVAVGVVIAAAATVRRGPAIAVLSSVPFVWLGAISYSLYLWHWPVYLVLTPDRTGLHDWVLFAVRVAVSVAMALVSYHLVEQPIRLRRVNLPRPGVLAVAGVGAVALLITAATAGAPAGDQLVQRTGPAPTVTTPGIPTTFQDLGLPPGATLPPAAPTDRPLRLAVVGDSVGFSLDYYRPKIPNVTSTDTGTVIGCGIMAPAATGPDTQPSEACSTWKDYWLRALDGAIEPDVVLMVTGAWEIRDHWLNGTKLTPNTPEATTYVDGQLEQALALIREHTQARVGALELSCAPRIEQGVGEEVLASTDVSRVDWFNDRLRALADRHPGEVVLLDINDHVCPNGEPVDKLDGVRLRYDGVHWTEQGAPKAWSWLLPELLDLAYRPS
ncbi:MAG: acyltransferase [Actinobacteria bacterium]|nr:acyltransferase [Actinomycetota bacterium]